MTLTVPSNDLGEFSRLPDLAKREVLDWLRVMEQLLAIGGRGIGRAIATQAARLGVSIPTVRRNYDIFRKAHDWRVLIDFRKYPQAREDASLPAGFVSFWKQLCEENQRKCKPAYRALIRKWRAWQIEPTNSKLAIKGYDLPPQETLSGHPNGWSYRNLLHHRPTNFELKTMRDGLGAALAKHGPKVLTTRVGLWPGSHIMVDDVTRDFKVLLLGKNTTARIQELGWLDVYSGSRFLQHRRPQYQENGKKNSLKESEMRFTVAAFVRNTGFSPRGTQILDEHGTAAIRQPLKDFLLEHSDGLLTVRDSGFTGKEQALAGFHGRGGGNPRHKAHLESLHNLLQNEAANLPAATGHDRNYPEWLFGLEAMTEEVCEALLTLPREKAELLIAPMAEYWQACSLLSEIDQRIDWRTDHQLEGWVKCGHVITEYRRDPSQNRWLSTRDFLALPPGEQHLITCAADSSPLFRRVRKLAPAEVFGPALPGFIRFPDHVIALMFCDDRLGQDLRSKPKFLSGDGDFEIQDELANHGEKIHFRGEVQTPEGGILRLQEGVGYRTVLNPFDPSALWIYGQRGEYLGTAAVVQRVCQLDFRAVQHALGQREHDIATLLTPIRERHAGAVAEIQSVREHNARLIDGTPAALPVPTRTEAASQRNRFAEAAARSRELLEAADY